MHTVKYRGFVSFSDARPEQKKRGESLLRLAPSPASRIGSLPTLLYRVKLGLLSRSARGIG